MMTFIVCIALGLVSGLAANLLLHRNLGRPLLNFAVGATGALIGGYFSLQVLVGSSAASGVTLWSMLVAVAGAILLLGIKHAVLGNRPAGT